VSNSSRPRMQLVEVLLVRSLVMTYE